MRVRQAACLLPYPALTKPAPPVGEFRSYDTALVFHPDGSRLYCGNEDGRVRVFDTTTRTELPEESWQAHSGAVTALAISNNTRLLATSGDTTLNAASRVRVRAGELSSPCG